MKVKQAFKGVWPAVWYGLKWYFPQYAKPAEVVWGGTKSLRKARRKNKKIDNRIADIDKAIVSLNKQSDELMEELMQLSAIRMIGDVFIKELQ